MSNHGHSRHTAPVALLEADPGPHAPLDRVHALPDPELSADPLPRPPDVATASGLIAALI